jgi:hypothetical protein
MLTWAGSFVVLTALLLARNSYLLSARIYEDSDFAANTISVLQAKRFTLLTGNYSKEGFYHPGPAFLYVMAGGESFFHDFLHVVPTPWNGQMLAILLLNAALLAACLAVIARHDGSLVTVLTCLTALLLAIAVHPLTVNSAWMPYAYFAPTLLLLVSAASVATGQTADLPLLALSALLCINGQAEFLLFAPSVVVVALAALIVTRRRLPGRASPAPGSPVPASPVPASPVPARHWVTALAVAVALALPIIVNTAVHWPGVFGSYFSYMHAIRGTATSHSLVSAIKYPLRFWWPGIPDGASAGRALIAGGVLGVLALAVTLRCPQPGLRRFLLWSVAMIILMTVLFVYYSYKGIDNNSITQTYLGYFYWAAPVLAALVAVAGVVAWAGHRAGPALLAPFAAAAVAAAVVAGVVPQHRDNPDDPPATYVGEPGLPHDVQVLAAAARGRPIVLQIDDNAWVTTAGIVAYADRTGVRSCIVNAPGARWGILFRQQSMCTPREMRSGVQFAVGDIAGGKPRLVRHRGRVVVTVPGTDTAITTE